MKEPIFPRERPCVALRYVVIGDAQFTVAANYHMSPAIVGRIISETCKAIWDELMNKGYLDHPKSKDNWLKVALEFEDRWSFPNALGATDRKHVVMQAPSLSESSFLNYKKTQNVVSMAICNT